MGFFLNLVLPEVLILLKGLQAAGTISLNPKETIILTDIFTVLSALLGKTQQ